MIRFRLAFLSLALVVAAVLPAQSPDRHALWAERVNCVVAIEFFTETELDRRPTEVFGVVADDAGTIIFPAAAVNPRVTASQLKDFRVYLPGAPVTAYFTATYLGPDEYTGWHFIRVEEKARARLVPITRYARPGDAAPAIAEELWGIGLRKKDEDFAPFFLSSRVAIIQRLPQRTAVLAQDVAGQGMPVFDAAGGFVGLTVGGFGQTFVQYSARDRGGLPVVMVNPDESSAVTLAEEVLPHLGRVPQNPEGRPLAWLGANGLEPLDPEVAAFMKLGGQTGLVVSEVLEGSPAEKAGLRERDIILAFAGAPLPLYKPDRVVAAYLDREIDRRRPGDQVTLGVLRGEQRLDLTVTLEDAPTLPREAERRYFDFVGLTLRAFTYADGAVRRAKLANHRGVIAHFVKANAPASTAGLRMDDWIKEIDGVPVTDFAGAAAQLAAIEADRARSEFVVLVDRGGETAVLRVKLK